MTKFIECYQQALRQGAWQPDSAQQAIIKKINSQFLTYQKLFAPQHFFQKIFSKKLTPKGIYLWGGVGMGKTVIMDWLYGSLNTRRKERIHFHAFMQRVHDDLKRLQGRKDPLLIIAREFSIKAAILCFDEIVVHDIADAMLLGRLFQALMARGVLIIATSNRPPKDLYKNGLARDLFMPAIHALEKHCEVIELKASKDYRYQKLTQSGWFFHPNDQNAEVALSRCFDLYSHHQEDKQPLVIVGRAIPFIKKSKSIIWFDFTTLCAIPRNQHDYLELCDQYEVIILSNIPEIKNNDVASITYLINLVDVCYDTHTLLIASSVKPISDIYIAGPKCFEFKRTQSRLIEMQSEDYLKITQRTPI